MVESFGEHLETHEIEYVQRAKPCCCCSKKHNKEVLRRVILGKSISGFMSNKVVTALYTPLTFIPVNLYEQFKKPANIYFLSIAILQCVPQITTTNSIPTLALPLSIVVIFNMVKDAVEDYKRHMSDEEQNGHKCRYVPIAWECSEEERKEDDAFEEKKVENHTENIYKAANRKLESIESMKTGVFINEASLERVGKDRFKSVPSLEMTRNYVSDAHHSSMYNSESDLPQKLQEQTTKHMSSNENNGEYYYVEGEEADAEAEAEIAPEDRPVKYLPIKVWRQVQVGDIICTRNKQVFPADIVLLATSDENGVAYIQTSSLDGETNMKIRQAKKTCVDLFGNIRLDTWMAVANASGYIACDPPNADLNKFDGYLSLNVPTMQDEPLMVPLSQQQLMLRGCKLCRTEWAIGVVVYTGHEAKIEKNAATPPHKVSHLERMTGITTYIIFGIQLILCLIGGIVTGVQAGDPSTENRTYYANRANSPPVEGLLRFLTLIVLYSNLVPISLVVSLGFVKTVQGIIIQRDKDMYHAKSDAYAKVRTSELNEELGQVEHVFADKTGTLTQNCMEFRKCSIRGVSYGEGLTDLKRTVLRKQGLKVPPEPTPDPNSPKVPNVNFVDKLLNIEIAEKGSVEHIEFFMHLAINHSVVPDYDAAVALEYTASSPDEGALAYGAQFMGITFLDRSIDTITLSVLGEIVEVKTLATIEFDSFRKRSSVLCMFTKPKVKYVLYCKGADTAIIPKLSSSENTEIISRVSTHMEDYAVDGLRTLCIAKRDLPHEFFDSWYARYQQACLALDDRTKKIEELVDEIEQDLTLQGATGIEDKLQEEVGETIERLTKAGINIWMLTGDKVETAINIGLATNMITNRMDLFALSNVSHPTQESVVQAFEKQLEIWGAHHNPDTGRDSKGIVVDGVCLAHLLESEPDYSELFRRLARYASVVICCRVTPKQKGIVVTLIKEREKKVTLAIGDGANDCYMIQCAHVGVGIRGEEGLQAFNNADYGISQFRFLAILLLVHGRWCYRRTSRLVLYMFYKNTVLVLPLFYFSCMSLFSGQKIYYEFYYQLYNVVLTAIPVVFYGIVEQDVNRNMSMMFPQLYRYGTSKYYMNIKTILMWVCNGLWHSIIIFTLPLFTFGFYAVTSPSGEPSDMWFVGNVMFVLIVVVVNLKLLLETYYFVWLTIFGFWITFVMLVAFGGVLFCFPQIGPEVLGMFQLTILNPIVYVLMVCVPVIALSRDFIYKCYKRQFAPELYHKLQDVKAVQKQLNMLVDESKRLTDPVKPTPFVAPTYNPRGFAFSEAVQPENFQTHRPGLSVVKAMHKTFGQ